MVDVDSYYLHNLVKNELDGINKKLKDNEDRYTELIRKQKESGLTVEETKELEELQKISGELINQKNILEENIRLKKEDAAATANEIADTLLKQQEVLKFMDKTGDKIKNVFNVLQKYILSTILAAYKDFEDRFSIVEEKLPAIEMVRKASLNKVGRFIKQDIRELCPSLSISSIEGALRKMVSEGELKREGSGKSTCYYRLK